MAREKRMENFSLEISRLDQSRQEINSEPVMSFFELDGHAPSLEEWEFVYGKDLKEQLKIYRKDETADVVTVKVASRIWRGLSFKKPGNYMATVTYNGDKKHKAEWIVRPASCKPLARNAILFIADGTTTNMITAARVMAKKHRNGKYFDKLQLDKMDFIGHILTNSLDSIFTESSNSASAYNTGHKAPVSAVGVYPDSNSNQLDDPKVELLAELARRRSKDRGGKMAIGIVTTADVTDATPAAVYAHHRYAYFPETFLDQFLNGASNASVPVAADVLLGGGGKHFTFKIKRKGCSRNNHYMKFKAKNYHIVHTRKELNEYDGQDPLLGIFHQGTMDTYVDRQMNPVNTVGNNGSPLNDGTGATDQPTLVEMTKSALSLLKKRGGDAGFFAMIEGASPDKQMHYLDYHRSLVEILEFDQAVKAAVEWARENDPSTLIVVTSDHGQGFDVYGTVDTQLFNSAKNNSQEQYESIATYWNSGWPDYEDKDGDGFPDSLDVRTVFAASTNNNPSVVENFQIDLHHPRHDHYESYDGYRLLPNVTYNPSRNLFGIARSANTPNYLSQTAHTITDVPVFSKGPGANLFAKVMDNTEVFFNLAHVLGLGN
ncbi:hypothetical protein L0F63_004970 [Massospora cicadina]|nr:hypothetical protein L0F63_004970 [Massospora cicadina]